MGVTGLWSLLSPVGRQIEVRALANKKLAVDASIWIVQFLKAMRKDDGTILQNAHLLGFFKRICRLLFHGVKPVFVFDGSTPELKKRTIKLRRKQRDNQSTRLKRTAEKILLGRLKHRLLKGDSIETSSPSILPPTDNPEESSEEEEVEFEEELDFATVDMDWLFSLPPSQQYEHLVQMRDKQFASNRQVLSSVTGQPQKFSETQMDLFLKSSSIRQELQEMRRTVGGIGQFDGAQRLANEPNRVFIYHPDKSTNPTPEDTGLDPSNKNNASSKTVFPLDGTKTIVEASREFEERKRKDKAPINEITSRPRLKKQKDTIPEEEIEWESISSSQDQPSDLDQSMITNQILDTSIISNDELESSASQSEDLIETLEDNLSSFSDSEMTKSDVEEPSIVPISHQDPPPLEESFTDLQTEFVKLSKQVEAPTEEMFIECQELLQLFGIPYIIAPTEAEAQCAFLNEQCLVDGVITEDSDVFLFGAQKVYKNIFNNNKYVEEYLMEDIEEELGLNRGRIIDLALLLGSDYTEGVHGIGIVNAMETLSAFQGPNCLQDFAKWAREDALEEEVLELTKPDPENEDQVLEPQEVDFKERFKEKHKELRRSWEIPTSFPNDFVKKAYHEPAVDSNLERFSFGRPNLDRLRSFCTDKFNWTESKSEEVLCPVLDANAEKQRQGSIDVFLTERRRFAKIKSQRLQEAVVAITGKYNPEMMIAAEPVLDSRTSTFKKRRLS